MVARLRDRLRRLWRDGLPPNSPAAYVFAFGCVGVTLLVRLAVSLAVGSLGLFVIYIPALLISSVVGGAGAGIAALVFGGIAGWAGMVWGSPAPLVLSPVQSTALLAYVAAGALVVWVADSYRRSIRRLRAEEAQRSLLLRELQHRNANTLTVVQAIVSQSLKSNREDVRKITRRIAALAATNELLTRSSNQTAELRDVLEMELRPYGEARVAMHGRALALVPELARALSLVVHELTTNAAKYGALSRPEGFLAVKWTALGQRVQIIWAESGGPPVPSWRERGFGTGLLESALDSFQGKVESDFRPEGLLCAISFVLPSPEGQAMPGSETLPGQSAPAVSQPARKASAPRGWWAKWTS